MPELDAGLSPNRSVALELRDEGRLVREGYELLDEKRVLLATEILQRLAQHRRLSSQWLLRYRAARAALAAALAALGLEAVQVHPVAPRDLDLAVATPRIAGIVISRLETATLLPAAVAAPRPVWPSAQTEAVTKAFAAVVELGVQVAMEEQNLRRLAREYLRTDRRARALENVLLPELEASLRFVEEQLEYLDTEEAVRVHWAHRRSAERGSD